MAKATGKAASRPTLPRMSQVSLPSQIGAIEFITSSRALAVGREVVEHADAEIEAVERDIEEDADGEDGGPDRNEVERGHQRVSAVAGASASIGDFGRPLTTGASSSAAAGPRQTIRSMV